MINTSFEQRAERRNRLIGLLRSEEYWKTSDLREQLGVSQRTLMRELAELKKAGYPIESDRGRGGGIRLNGRWGIDRLNLSHHEVIELILSLAIMESLKSPLLTSNLKAIKQKLFQAFPQEQRSAVSNIRKRIMIGDNAAANTVSRYTEPAQALSESIAEAFLQQRCLEIDYQSDSGEKTTRVIEAQYILLNWPIWYITAWDHLRSSSRMFRIDRIQNARMIDGYFQLRPIEEFIGAYTPYYKSI
ncbi:helix-turn-helix transcriptional regulator [Marinomonas balearica]|uniref:Putative DNA-binding transcriptional regulator YafY n=1 Tax=Marinomonas balearica TaxID=491947 RepID=A0A4R6M4Y0_9GAMM|nr:WYL domain-containing protein [Marinomonas balearica]TDO95795.1 putative DNA-binding transcriptional regulator YafY [Marinomonas balearica]